MKNEERMPRSKCLSGIIARVSIDSRSFSVVILNLRLKHVFYLGEESSEEVVSTIQSHTATTLAPKKSKRENRWEYNIQSYQTHIQQKSTSSSTATTMFTLVTLLFSIFIQ